MTFSEENYLKTIYHLTNAVDSEVCSTNAIAEKMDTKASSVTDMLKKLAEKDLIHYIKYQGVSLTDQGKLAAKMIVRKHRLWEVFLVEKLNFSWDEVHDIAEQLEHIKSEQLINRLDDFLGNPTEDPHGDPIPNEKGVIQKVNKLLLSEAETENLYLKLIEQINKDFNLANEGIDLPLSLLPNEIKLQLHEKIYRLIQYKFVEYLNLLYIIDVSEDQIKKLDGSDLVNLSEDVAFLILKREWQKVWFRNKF